MTKNKLTDLNNHLFAQLERLNDEDLEGEELEAEIERSKAVAEVSKQIISNANTVMNAVRYRDNMLASPATMPKMLGSGCDDM